MPQEHHGSRRDPFVPTWLWVALVIVGLLMWEGYTNGQEAKKLQELRNDPLYGGTFFSDTGSGGYYENPAPGDDGTTDCAPGQPPVYVGSNDPNGLDSDGDGVGCEG